MKKLRLMVLVGLAVLVGACAETPTRRTALLLADEIESYRDDIGGKINAERTYYRNVNNTLKDSAKRAFKLEEEVYTLSAVDEQVDELLVEKKGVSLSRM